MIDGGDIELLTDDQIWTFIVNGFLILQPEHSAPWLASIRDDVRALAGPDRLHFAERVPRVLEALGGPRTRGALASLLGPDYVIHPHRHVHETRPGETAQTWHQDFTSRPHATVDTLIMFFYPEDVTLDMGPTIVMPGTHLRLVENDQLTTYTNLEGQVPLVVPAGSLALLHRSTWHAATGNRSARPRLMLKFMADRSSAPSAPSWRHDAQAGERARREFLTASIGGLGWCTDYRLEWERRWSLWCWLRGIAASHSRADAKDLIV